MEQRVKKVRLTLSKQAERYASPSAPRESRLMASRGALPLPPIEIATVLFALMHDVDSEIKSTARDSLENLPETVMAAVLGNGVLALLKLFAFIVSGSGAMLSETIHSLADTINQAMLWLGIRLSERPADREHPYGYGAERFFWSLVSAMGIFFLGAGITLYHGIHTLLHPGHIEITYLTWVVLALALLIEGAVLILAVRAADQRRAGRSWREFLRTARDPALLAVLGALRSLFRSRAL